MKKRIVFMSIIAALILTFVGIFPVSAAGTYCTVNMSDTFTITCGLTVKNLDGTSQPGIRTATLVITDNTVATKGIISTATLAITGYATMNVTGYVGTGSSPYIHLYGTSADANVTLNGRVHAKGAVAESISGRIDGGATHSDGSLGTDAAPAAAATWSTVATYLGTTAVLLTQAAGAGSTHVNLDTVPGTIRLRDLDTITTGWSLAYDQSANAHGPQIELKFQKKGFPDPNGLGHVDVTLLPNQGVGTAAWVVGQLTNTTKAVYYGNDPFNGTAFSEDSGGLALSAIEASINNQAAMKADGTNYTCGDWLLTRVRIELWEAGGRTCYIDDVVINNHLYSFEPVTFAGSFKALP